jgi:hypothetical protein
MLATPFRCFGSQDSWLRAACPDARAPDPHKLPAAGVIFLAKLGFVNGTGVLFLRVFVEQRHFSALR